MSWVNLLILSTNAHADNFSDFVLENGAISASIQDQNLNKNNEEIIFGEPHNGPQQFWEHTQINALFRNLNEAKKALKKLEKKFSIKLSVEFKEVQDEDWVKKTQDQFHPISINNKLWIIPTWHDVVDKNAINLILDPGLAFGTGSHPTTYLCIEWLINNIQKKSAVLDYGCGSGILSICAKKLGADEVLGVDIDPQAISASIYNSQKNKVLIEFSNTKKTTKCHLMFCICANRDKPLARISEKSLNKCAVIHWHIIKKCIWCI